MALSPSLSSESEKDISPLPDTKVLTSQNGKNASEKRYSKEEKKEIFQEYLFYEDCIRRTFFISANFMFIIIVLLIYVNTNYINHFNGYFYMSCNVVPGTLPIEEVFRIHEKIDDTQNQIYKFHQKAAQNPWLEKNESDLTVLENSFNEYLDMCNSELKLREPCHMKRMKEFEEIKQQIFYLFILPYFIIVFGTLIYCFCYYQKLIKVSIKNNDILNTLHTKQIIKIFSFITTFFAFLLYIEYGNYEISISDIPLLCGKNDSTKKFVTKRCFYESFDCYGFPKMFQFVPDFCIMFIFYGIIAVFCFLISIIYHSYRRND